MTRSEAQAFISAFVALRESATDEQAVLVPNVFPAWKPEKEYKTGDRIRYQRKLYKVITSHTSQEDWAPDVALSLFAQVLIPDPEVIPEWVQPDSTNPYQTGDKVTHNGSTWISTIDNNVWEPGTTGTENLWTEVTE